MLFLSSWVLLKLVSWRFREKGKKNTPINFIGSFVPIPVYVEYCLAKPCTVYREHITSLQFTVFKAKLKFKSVKCCQTFAVS